MVHVARFVKAALGRSERNGNQRSKKNVRRREGRDRKGGKVHCYMLLKRNDLHMSEHVPTREATVFGSMYHCALLYYP